MRTSSGIEKLTSDAIDLSFSLLLSLLRKSLQLASALSTDLLDGRPMHAKVKVMIVAVNCRIEESMVDFLNLLDKVFSSSGKDASKDEGVMVQVLGFD